MTEENKDSTRPKLRLSRNAAETEPEKTSEPKPEATLEPKPEAALEPKPEAALEPKPEAAPEPKPEAAPEPMPEAALEPKPEATPEPKPEATPEPKPEATLEPKPEAAPEPKPEAAPEPKQEAALEPKPDLNSTRPKEEAPVETSANPELRTPTDEAQDAPSFNPENPSSDSVEAPKAEEAKHSTLKVPSEPAPVENESSGPEVEEAIDRIDEDQEKRGLLTSIIVIFILLAVLGGSGYGLYYVLRSPGEAEAPASAGGEASQSETSEKESSGLLSGPIVKAKTAIAKVPAIDGDLEKDISTKDAGNITAEATPAEATPVEATPAKETKETVETAKVKANVKDDPEPATPPAAVQTNSAADFLTSAHIGGVREGDRPKLILNGESYIPGDLVDPGSGLRFLGFKDKKIAFRDAQGIVYIKSF